jgi:chromate reductase, NAD(P)H dehydrogenase (quinone)
MSEPRENDHALLRAYAKLAPSSFTFADYNRIGALPHFNPDSDGDNGHVHLEVRNLRNAIADADAIVISTPEYAHALPGSFKNALDWLVSDPAFAGKPVVILHVARGSTWALESLREVLRTMSARLIQPASISLSLGSNQLDEIAVLARRDLREQLVGSLARLRDAIKTTP